MNYIHHTSLLLVTSLGLTSCATDEIISAASDFGRNLPIKGRVGLPGNLPKEAQIGIAVLATFLAINEYKKRQATERQREIARSRARTYVKKQNKKGKTPKKKIAVKTQTSPGAKETIMIYDRDTDQLSSNTAYDLDESVTAKSASTGKNDVKIDGTTAELAF